VFVREYLAPILMTMSPRDGLTGDGWVLADEALTSILIDAREGDTITLAQALPAATYRGTWFDPESGLTRPLGDTTAWRGGAVIEKPTGDEWLLLLVADPS